MSSPNADLWVEQIDLVTGLLESIDFTDAGTAWSVGTAHGYLTALRNMVVAVMNEDS